MPESSGNSSNNTNCNNTSTPPLPIVFDSSSDWIVYQARIENYFDAYGITDDNRKRALLLTSLSEEVYTTLTDVCFPTLPETKTFKDLCEVMKQLFKPEVSVYNERARFYDLKQKPNESITAFVVRLKSATRYCKFGNYFKDVVRDKFVCGLLKGPIFEKVSELESTATFESCVQAALKKELVVKHRESKVEGYDVCKISHPKQGKSFNNKSNSEVRGKQSKSQSSSGKDQKCFACGESNHLFKFCKYKSFKCKVCKGVGHLARVCKEAKGEKKLLNLESEEDFKQITLHCIEISEVNNIDDNKDDKFYTELMIMSETFKFEIDTGSPICACSKIFYDRHFSDIPLQKFESGLRSYNKSPMKAHGYITVEAKLKTKTYQMRLVVIENGGAPLIGRDFLRAIDPSRKNNFVNKIECKDPGIIKLINDNEQLFRSEIGCYRYGKVHFELKDNVTPVFRKARPVPLAFQSEYKRQIQDKIASGILKKVDYSVWGTPLVSAPKPNGGLRICGDYSITVNPHIKPVVYSLPLIDDVFAILNGGEHFSKLDLSDAYHQLELDDESQKLLAWSTQEGLFVPTRMPFGISPASSIFQSIIAKTLQGCKKACAVMDDIIVTGTNRKDHIENLEAVFKKIADAGFTLRKDKCEFFKEQVKYLGYIVDKHGLHKDPCKVEAILNAPRPTDVAKIKSFVGVVGFYSRFFPNLAQVLAPIYNLLKKESSFVWSEECQDAFDLVKSVMASDKVLAHYNQNLPVKLTCDASIYGLGAAIFHVMEDGTERPIAYASRTLSKAEKNYSTPDREALAIYFGVKKFAHFLIGRSFILKTDHKPLLGIFGSKKGIPPLAAGRLQRWAMYLSNFTFEIEHIKGTDNIVADFLSRFPVDSEDNESNDEEVSYLNFLANDEEYIIDQSIVKAESLKDPVIVKVKQFLRDGWPANVRRNRKLDEVQNLATKKEELTVENDILMWGYRVVIPQSLRKRLLDDLHATHSGIVKMKARARSYFWWLNIDKDIEKLSNNCVQCRFQAQRPPKVPFSPWRETTTPFERIHADFLGPFRNHMFLLITDSHSKWPEVYKMSSTNASQTVDKVRDYFARYGLPDLIVTDNGTQFTSNEFTEFCKRNGVQFMTIAAYEPQSNGAAENAVKSFKAGIEKACGDPKNKSVSLDTVISRYLFYYRSSVHATTKETPHNLLFGRDMRTHFDRLKPKLLEVVKEQIEQRVNQDMKSSKPQHKHFKKDDGVIVLVFKKDKKAVWERAVIIKRCGINMFLCRLPNGRVVKKHSDQIQNRKFEDSTNPEVERSSDNSTKILTTRSGKSYQLQQK